MGYQVWGRKLGRDSGQKKALFRGLISELVRYGEIKTTEARAKAVRSQVDRLLTYAKKGGLAKHRLLRDFLADDKLVKTMVGRLAPRLNKHQGGYTRMVRVGTRRGDNALMVRLEWVEKEEEKPKKEEKKKEVKPEEKKGKVKKKEKDEDRGD